MQPASEEPRELSELSSGFLAHLAVSKGRARATLEGYRSDLIDFEGWLLGLEATIESTERSDIELYLADHLGKHDANSTRRALSAIRGLYGYLLGRGLLEDDPTVLVRAPKVPMRLPKALSEEVVNELLESVSGSSPLDLRDRLMLEVLYGSGLRISELVGMSATATKFDDGLFQVTGKGSKQRIVPISNSALQFLSEYLLHGRSILVSKSKSGDSSMGMLFVNSKGGPLTRQGAWLALKARAAAIGIGADFSPHALRHSCATHMVDHGADLRVVQELLGHADLQTTQIYTKVSLTRMLAVHSEFHPRSQAHRLKGG